MLQAAVTRLQSILGADVVHVVREFLGIPLVKNVQ